MKNQNLEQGGPEFLAVSPEGTVTLADSSLLLNADYSRSGSDLHLNGDDGSELIVTGYFNHAQLPSLVSSDGQMLSGETVGLLAGPVAPGQYAQMTGGQFGEPIGQVESLEGPASAQRSNGLKVELEVGSPVFQGDVVSAGADATLGITFLDKTVFTIEDGASLVLNELVYNPGGTSNSMLFNLIGGTAAFVAGAVAKSGDMKIETPVAVMAIRGTAPFAKCTGGEGGCEFGGESGEYVLLHKLLGNILATVNDPSIVVTLSSPDAKPVVSSPSASTQEAMQRVFDALHRTVNILEDRLNDGEAPVREAGTGSPRFTAEGIIESIAGFFTSSITKLLGEEQVVAAVEDTEEQIEQIIDPVVTGATDEDSVVRIEIITEDDILGLGSLASVIGSIVTSGLGDTHPSADGLAVIYDPGVSYNSLSEGETASVRISVLIDLGNGTTQTEIVGVTVLGVNDDPTANPDTASGNENAAIGIDVLANDTDPDTSDQLTVSSASIVSGLGMVSLAADGKSIIYDPNGAYESLAAGDSATVEISYTISDGNGGTDTSTVTVTVNGRNDGPNARPDTATTDEDNGVSIPVLNNDTDPDGDVLSVTSASVTDGLGSASVSADGLSVLYDPGNAYNHLAVGESVDIEITYEISDGNGGTDTSTAVVTVNGVNDDPDAKASQASTNEDKSVVIDVLANDSDPDTSDDLMVTGASITNGLGTVSVAADGKSIIYDPGNAYNDLAVGEKATVKISYSISDGNGGTDTSIVTVTVNGRNDGPKARPDTATTDEDNGVSIPVLNNDTDPDGDALSVTSASVTDGLGSASVSGDGQSVLYDPGNAYNHLAVGESVDIEITYEISDGNGGTDTSTAIVTVNGVNDDPNAKADQAATNENKSLTIDVLANDTDPDTSDVLSVITALVTSGLGSASVSADGKSVNYDPGNAYNDLAVGEKATVKIKYTISDGNGGTDTATVTVIVNGRNDGPTARPDTASTDEDNGVSIAVLDNDTDPDGTDVLSVTSATVTDGLGSASVSADGLSVLYDPGNAYNHLAVGESVEVEITYEIFDGNGGTDTSTAIVTVNGANDDPTARADQAATNENKSVVISVLSNDTDPDTSDDLSVTAASITNGLGMVSISGDGKSVIYDPAGAYNDLAVGEKATVKISYSISDGNGGTDTATVTVTVNGRNDGPTARPDTATTDEDNSVSIAVLGNDTDPDGTDSLSVTSASVTGGLGSASVSADGLSVLYDPGNSYNHLAVEESVEVEITYTISDGNGGTDTSTVTVTVNGVNDDPTATADLVATNENKSVVINVLANDTDPDTSDDLSVTAASITNGLGTVSISGDGKSVIYDSVGAYNNLAVGEKATVKISYTISDGNGGTDTAIVTVTVNGRNDAPTANLDLAATDEETSVLVNLTGNDTDPDTSDTLNVISANVAEGMGTVSISADGQSIVFDPNGDFEYLPAGETTIVEVSYTISDGNGGQDTGVARITITGVNDAADITGDMTGEVTEREEDDTAQGTLLVSDVDLGESEFQASTQTGIYGSLALTAAGLWVYTLDNADADTIALTFDESATDVFTVSSFDGTTAQITITVNGAGFDFEYNNFGGNSGSSEFKSIDSGNIEAAEIDLIITPMPLILDDGTNNKVNATQTDLGIGTGQKISADEGIRMEIVTGASSMNQNDIDMLEFDAHVAVQVFKAGVVQVQGAGGQTATLLVRLVYADGDSNFDTQADAGDVVVAISASDVTVTKATGNTAVAEMFTLGDTVVITGLQEGDIFTVNSPSVFNRVEIENGSDEIDTTSSLAFGGSDFEIGVLGFNMPDELLLIGDNNDNVLTGEESNDTLDGRGGLDTLEGGDGVDVFVLGQDLSTGAMADIIIDYTEGVDVVDVTELFDLAAGDFTEGAVQEYIRYVSGSDNDADDPAGATGDIFVDLNGAAGGENFILAAHLNTAPDSVVFKVDDGSIEDYVTVI